MFFYIIIFFATSFCYTFENTTIDPILLIVVTLVFGMLAMSSFNYDATSKTDKYILTFPTTKKEVVASKYLLAIMATFLGMLINIIINVAVSYKISCLIYERKEV